ncbi:LrgB family protein [Dendrosporobacter sp. 1207_IL3150]|uniref:LrgB family protein n=1 Tax=Dendrosporobacter sp. 1207_IL3150 TaxID=3084054 RepID=UPI002FD8AE7B
MDYMIIISTIILTVCAYLVSRFLFLRYGHPLFNIVLLGTSIVVVFLLLAKWPYSAYAPGKEIMTFLLGPATVALAIPLYKNRELLRKHGILICVSVATGSIVSMGLAILITKFGGLSKEVIISAGPKSVTAPIAIEIAQMAGGDPALAVAFVVATGTFGGALGPTLLTWFKITNPKARGLALGTVAHAQGVAMSLLEGEDRAAMASSAMALAAVFASAFAPILLYCLI